MHRSSVAARWALGLLLASVPARADRFALDHASATLVPGTAAAAPRFELKSAAGACALVDAIFADGFE